jgi:voltage-gated potassium channel
MPQASHNRWQQRIHTVVYESHTAAGKTFDISLLILIVSSIIVVMLDSVAAYNQAYGQLFDMLEWIFTILFTIEYILRLVCIRRPLLYAISFLGIIDLLSIIPGYLSIMYAGVESLLVLRSLRLLRIFRIFKLSHFLLEMHFLGGALRASLKKISIFMMVVIMIVIITGSIMYLIEGGRNGFTNIPTSIYWAIVTTTTVGYGDISPVTAFGKFFASLMMLLGYAIIAVPTGIITTEMALSASKGHQHKDVCPNCGKEGHDRDARYCKYCGSGLDA